MSPMQKKPTMASIVLGCPSPPNLPLATESQATVPSNKHEFLHPFLNQKTKTAIGVINREKKGNSVSLGMLDVM